MGAWYIQSIAIGGQGIDGNPHGVVGNDNVLFYNAWLGNLRLFPTISEFRMELSELNLAIKQLIITECDKPELTVESITDDEIIFGPNTQVALDSLDALQISVAIKKTYGVRIQGSGESRNAFKNVQSLSEYIIKNR